jgi:nitrile hydratase accessory protein
MNEDVDRFIEHVRETGALPNEAGDLAFEEPWQVRAFGMAVVLYDRGTYEWEEMTSGLIEEIRASETGDTDDAAAEYYEQWLASLEELLVDRGLVSDAELDHRAEAFAEGDRDASEFVVGERPH